MCPGNIDGDIRALVKFARERGASHAKIVNAKDIIIDKRVRLKCSVPRCDGYDRNLMCPPNVMPVDEFAEILASYRKAILLQVEADVDSTDKSSNRLDGTLCSALDQMTAASKWQRKLHQLVNDVETEAFKRGYYLAAGLTGGECCLCEECVQPRSGKACRHPFEARPSMEAMGIDVIRTCGKAGMPVLLSSSAKVRWTGVVFLQ